MLLLVVVMISFVSISGSEGSVFCISQEMTCICWRPLDLAKCHCGMLLCRTVHATFCSTTLLSAETLLVPSQWTWRQSMHPKTSTPTSWHWSQLCLFLMS